jgi:hypothetical protein
MIAGCFDSLKVMFFSMFNNEQFLGTWFKYDLEKSLIIFLVSGLFFLWALLLWAGWCFLREAVSSRANCHQIFFLIEFSQVMPRFLISRVLNGELLFGAWLGVFMFSSFFGITCFVQAIFLAPTCEFQVVKFHTELSSMCLCLEISWASLILLESLFLVFYLTDLFLERVRVECFLASELSDWSK